MLLCAYLEFVSWYTPLGRRSTAGVARDPASRVIAIRRRLGSSRIIEVLDVQSVLVRRLMRGLQPKRQNLYKAVRNDMDLYF